MSEQPVFKKEEVDVSLPPSDSSSNSHLSIKQTTMNFEEQEREKTRNSLLTKWLAQPGSWTTEGLESFNKSLIDGFHFHTKEVFAVYIMKIIGPIRMNALVRACWSLENADWAAWYETFATYYGLAATEDNGRLPIFFSLVRFFLLCSVRCPRLQTDSHYGLYELGVLLDCYVSYEAELPDQRLYLEDLLKQSMQLPPVDSNLTHDREIFQRLSEALYGLVNSRFAFLEPVKNRVSGLTTEAFQLTCLNDFHYLNRYQSLLHAQGKQ